jgi:uncharacterized RmlC-like cupin family protein
VRYSYQKNRTTLCATPISLRESPARQPRLFADNRSPDLPRFRDSARPGQVDCGKVKSCSAQAGKLFENSALEACMDQPTEVIALRPEQSVMTRQGLPYFIGISGKTVGAQGLAMHLVVIPPGARATPHRHLGYETGIYVLEGRVCTRWGERLENELVSEAGDFLFVPPGVPHIAINLSDTEPARAIVARNDPDEQDKVETVKIDLAQARSD